MTAIVVDWREKKISDPTRDPAAAKRLAETRKSTRDLVMSVSAVPAATGDEER